MLCTPKRSTPFIGILAFAITLVLLQSIRRLPSWREMPQVVGFGDVVSDTYTLDSVTQKYTKPVFSPGHAKPPGSSYTRVLVIARTLAENVSWIDEENLDITKKIYVADDPHAPLHPP